MGPGIIIALLVVALLVVGVRRLVALRRAASDPRRRRRWTAALVGTTSVALVAVVIAVSLVVGGPDYSGPVPQFPSLAAQPDASLHGTVAYVVVTKDVAAKAMSECARVTLASGGGSRDLLCWSFDPAAPATVAWLDPAHLLVTLFTTGPHSRDLRPEWAKIVEVSSGSAQDVPAADLGKRAVPPSGPTTNAAGETVVATGKDGNLTLAVRGRSGTRILLAVRDANAGWNLRSGPAWSPDGTWILWSDGGRLLVTTSGARSSTRVLSTAEVFGVAADYGLPTFAVNGADVPPA